MQVTISVRHGALSDEAQAKITEKVEKLSRLFDRLVSMEVTVNLEHRDEPQVELSVSAEHKHDFKASHRAGDLMVAVEQVVHKLEQQLRKSSRRFRSTTARPRDRRDTINGPRGGMMSPRTCPRSHRGIASASAGMADSRRACGHVAGKQGEPVHEVCGLHLSRSHPGRIDR